MTPPRVRAEFEKQLDRYIKRWSAAIRRHIRQQQRLRPRIPIPAHPRSAGGHFRQTDPLTTLSDISGAKSCIASRSRILSPFNASARPKEAAGTYD
jgi:hypothetical protein